MIVAYSNFCPLSVDAKYLERLRSERVVFKLPRVVWTGCHRNGSVSSRSFIQTPSTVVNSRSFKKTTAVESGKRNETEDKMNVPLKVIPLK